MKSRIYPSRDGIYAVFGAAALMAFLAAPITAQTGGIPGVLAPGVASELVQEGFTFTEGPVGTADGGLYFSDIRVNRVFHLDAAGKITVARENTNGTNGIALTREGDLLFAEGEGKRISKRGRDNSVTTVTDSFEGKPFLAPNDLIVDARGGIYFTDPGPRPVVAGRPTYVFYLPAGAKEPIAVDTRNPNGNEPQWIGWNPIGPYDSSDAGAERYLGWHRNTGDPTRPTRFALACSTRVGTSWRSTLLTSPSRLIQAVSQAPT